MLKWREKQLYKHKRGELAEDRVTRLQAIDFWGSIEAHPTCLAEDCSKYAAFDGCCHLHSSSGQRLFACFPSVLTSGTGDVEENDGGEDQGEIEAALSDAGTDDEYGDEHGVGVGEDDDDHDAYGDHQETESVLSETQDHNFGGIDDDGDDTHQHENETGPAGQRRQAHEDLVPWDNMFHALSSYINRHGHPPRAREENPALYDWMQQQKQRVTQMQNLFNSC